MDTPPVFNLPKEGGDAEVVALYIQANPPNVGLRHWTGVCLWKHTIREGVEYVVHTCWYDTNVERWEFGGGHYYHELTQPQAFLHAQGKFASVFELNCYGGIYDHL